MCVPDSILYQRTIFYFVLSEHLASSHIFVTYMVHISVVLKLQGESHTYLCHCGAVKPRTVGDRKEVVARRDSYGRLLNGRFESAFALSHGWSGCVGAEYSSKTGGLSFIAQRETEHP